ncbi:hypothetical protein DFJ77DRAFT_459300 [Powellomyces hirtus]|nr:hypothetical protein DFJ77DRAFT_459300 [Powellomyces hirtus]
MDEQLTQCSICLELLHLPPDTPQDDPSKSPVAGLKGCGHLFHTACIQKMFYVRGETGRRCPLCREKFKVTFEKQPLFYLPFELVRAASNRTVAVPEDERRSAVPLRDDRQLRMLEKSHQEVGARNAKELARLKEECTALSRQIEQQTAQYTEEMQVMNQRHRDLVKEKEKALRDARTNAEIELGRTRASFKAEQAQLREFCKTLEHEVRKAEFIAQSSQKDTPDAWSTKFTQLVAGLDTVEECKNVLLSVHRKWEECRSDLKHWRSVAAEQQSSKKQKTAELASRNNELNYVRDELEACRTIAEQLGKKLVLAESRLEDARAEMGNLKVRYDAAREEVGMTNARLSEAERKIRLMSSDPAPKTNKQPSSSSSARGTWDISSIVDDYWDPVLPGIDGSFADTMSEKLEVAPQGKTSNPFAALTGTVDASSTRKKRVSDCSTDRTATVTKSTKRAKCSTGLVASSGSGRSTSKSAKAHLNHAASRAAGRETTQSSMMQRFLSGCATSREAT